MSKAKTARLALVGAFMLAGCDGQPAAMLEPDGPSLAAQGGWVEMVTGGGRWEHVFPSGSIDTWVRISVQKDAAGQVSGMYQYGESANGVHTFQFHGEPDCLALTPDGHAAIVIGPVTNSQTEGSTPVGSRVGFLVVDGGPAEDATAVALLTGSPFANITCTQALAFIPVLHRSTVNHGNLKISRR